MYRFTTKETPKAELLACVYCPEKGNYCFSMSCSEIYGALSRLRYYEDLEEQGRLYVSPFAVGDKVYKVSRKDSPYLHVQDCPYVISEYVYNPVELSSDDVSVWTYKTRKEAEEKLKELQSNEK